MRVGDIATGRAGDKGDMLDLTLVAKDDASYQLLHQALSCDALRPLMNKVVPGPITRYEIAGLRALKYVMPEALTGGVYASMRAGLHWQKAAIWLLLDIEIENGGLRWPDPETLTATPASTGR
jgi:hypothetical protein